MQCSLLNIRGQIPRKLITDDYTEYGDQAGLPFIKLQHKLGFGMNEPASIRGYQGADVIIHQDRDRRLSYKFVLSIDSDTGEACSALRPLVFEPEQRTNKLTACVPDTPFNRKKLACVYYHGAFADIMDEKIDREIDQMAREIQMTLPKEKTEADIIVEQDEENAILRRQASEKQAEIDELKIKAGIAEDARNAKLSNTPDETEKSTTIPLPDNHKPEGSDEPLEEETLLVPNPGDLPVTDDELKEVRHKITAEVKAEPEIAALIEVLKEKQLKKGKKARYYVNTKAYKTKVLSVINERYNDYMRKRNADNTGVCLDN